ncbi:polysaccharide biosynthesis tyrosine autokinase [Gordonia polyisoprenivorans]|uniref:polysaccharide biosynthesis tyrosine autokinase n=1 Tax=Gordonia polyisoprenivorans TaxID=84595 RepID=UPI002301A50A|nr:polysaccharide biosynthesis tyrosine autokinase [Gordonia polyisoprenivorans]WCB38601.1 polysaccharide biosynthesis tyrosine autokinase [Gordonia polyisoprenivorans]
MNQINVASRAHVERGLALRDAVRGVARRWWIVFLGTVLLGCVALLYCAFQPTIYRSSATLYVTSGSADSSSSAYQGSLASQQRVASYAELASSDAVLRGAIVRSGISVDLEDLRRDLSASSTPDTVLLVLSVDNRVASESAELSKSIAASLSEYVGTLEQPADGGLPLAKVTVVGNSLPEVVSPRVGRTVSIACLAGLLLGLVVSLTLWRFDSRIRDEGQVEDVVGSRPVGVIPFNESAEKGIAETVAGSGAFAESLRKLRTNLEFSSIDSPISSMVVTSSVAGEGKTFTAISLASVLSENGSRVLLVDADLRRPAVAARLGLNNSIGLTQYLQGDGALSELVQRPSGLLFDALCSGPSPHNPSEILASKRAEYALREASAAYDFLIIDTPPVLLVADPIVLGNRVDGVLVVARSGATKSDDLRSTIRDFGLNGCRVVGAVLNGVSSRTGNYYMYSAATEVEK